MGGFLIGVAVTTVIVIAVGLWFFVNLIPRD